MEKKNQIVEGALDLFMRMGVKSVNMDDVATHLGMSKKTLYQFVKNKSDLVEQSFAFHHKRVKAMMEGICCLHENAIDELFDIDEGVCRLMKNRHPSMVFNLKKHHPKVWGMVDDLKKKHIFKTVKNNLENGIKQGMYREEINTDIIAKLIMSRVDALVDDELFPLTEYDFRQLLKENRIYHIRGIATPKGIEHLEQKLRNE
ncbi:MAG: TetR/AcrR family transcriptional regulator [Bacteroidetes bacterium]|nr:TetR/AcrR family transcriptional regulator [Bacteroidota bacterium]